MATAEHLNVYLVTFNCGRELINPSAFAPHLFNALDGIPRHASLTTTGAAGRTTNASRLPDLIVLNLQEVAPIAYSFLGGSYLTPYFDRFTKLVELAGQSMQSGTVDRGPGNDEIGIDSQYINIVTRNLGLTAIMIFVRSDLISQVDGVMTAGVGVGVHETGNKGAVGVRLGWRLDDSVTDNTENDAILNLTFVSAHLAPMEGDLQRRHQDFKDITRGLVFTSDTKTYSSDATSTTIANSEDSGAEAAPLLSHSSDDDDRTATSETSASSDSLVGMYTGPTHLFFAGDLNYRTSISPPSTADVSAFPKLGVDPTHANHYSQLLKRDQLNIARKNNETLHGFTEEEIHFAPTYKYKYRMGGEESSSHVIEEADTKSWEWASHRWPSWCDRILFFQPAQKSTRLIPRTYTSLPMITTSDHRPVALSISIPLVPLSKDAAQQLAKANPIPNLDPNWQSRRNVARRREIVVGFGSYLALTREGNIFVLGGLVALFGSIAVFKNIGV